MKNEENQMDIELSEEIALGIYSNLAIITHSPAELVWDFVQIMPGMPKGKVRSRVVISPFPTIGILEICLSSLINSQSAFPTV